MKHYFRISALAVLAAFSINAWAQNSSDVKNDNVVNVVTGAGGTTGGNSGLQALSLMFPSQTAAPSMNGHGCIGSGTKVDYYLLGLYSKNRPVHEVIKGCGAPEAISMLGRMCQFNDARKLLDRHLTTVYEIDPRTQYAGGPEAYDKWVSENFKNLSFEECINRTVKVTTVVAPSAKNTKVVKLSTVTLFRTGLFDLTDTGKKAIVAALGDFDNKKVAISRVSGHTDNVGNIPANQQLSEKRARTVQAFLIEQGFVVDSVQGYGKTMPIAPGNSADARAMNRRVEIEIRQLTEQEVKAAAEVATK